MFAKAQKVSESTDLFSLELLPQARAAKEEVRNAHFLSFLVFGLQICLSELSFTGVNFRHRGYNHETRQCASLAEGLSYHLWGSGVDTEHHTAS